MSIIQQYAKSKGVKEIAYNDLDNVIGCFMLEYGYVAPVVDSKTHARVISCDIDIKNFFLHTKYLESVEPREPKTPEIIGILVEHKDGYRLIDGYHRFKWALDNRTTANFILLT